jgi:hypothetical protein
MTDLVFPMSPYAVKHTRPKDGITSPNSVRVYNSQPRTVTLQIRYAKGIASVNLSIAQVHGLIDALNNACADTFPPLSPEDLLTIVKAQ